MILTDREIQVSLATKQILIDPEPSPDSYSSTSVDLTLDSVVLTWKDQATTGAKPPILSPADPDFNYTQVVEKHTTKKRLSKSGVVLRPGEFVLAWTRERVSLPKQVRLAARVEGKSSLARLGIGVHVTAPTIHAGFEGQIQLEMRNNGLLHVRLLPGMRICQLIFEMSLGVPEQGYAGMFAGQSSHQ